MQIIPLDHRHRAAVNHYIKAEWSGPLIIARGGVYDSSALDGLVAVEGDILLGALLYRPTGEGCEVSVLFSLVEGQGVGGGLMAAVEALARQRGFRYLWLTTTNDNTPAIRFYQRRGWDLHEVRINGFKKMQHHKFGDAVIAGIDHIPILHEFEFRRTL